MDGRVTDGSWLSTEERFRFATRAGGIGVWEWDIETGAMRYSSVARELFGFGPLEDITLDRVRSATHPEDLVWTSANAQRALDPKVREVPSYEYRIIRADNNEVRWLAAEGMVIFTDAGPEARPLKYLGTVRDVTTRKRTSMELEASEARLRLAVEIADMALWEIDPATDAITVSPELKRLCGFDENADPGIEDFRALYAPGERERVAKEGELARAQGETKLQTVIKHRWPDRTEKWLLMRAKLVDLGLGSGFRIIGALIDVTDQKLQEQRLELIARELSHRVKNIITVIRSIANQTLKSDAQASRDFSLRLQALAVATDFMLKGSKAPVSLRKLLEAIVEPFETTETTTFELSGPELELPLPAVQSVAMAVHELCTNAVKYGSLSVSGGTVTVLWEQNDGRLLLNWEERGGPIVEKTGRRGFGTTLLTRALFHSPDRLTFDYHPAGVRCDIEVRL